MNKATGKWPASFVLHFTWILSYSIEIKKKPLFVPRKQMQKCNITL